MSNEERRQHPRQPFEGPVQARCGTWPEFIELYTQNLSQGGVFIQHDNPPERGSTVELSIQMPNHQVLELHGRVAHVVEPGQGTSGFGVEFVKVTDAAVKAIADLLRIAMQHRDAPPPPIPK